jgi:hypothetical protein
VIVEFSAAPIRGCANFFMLRGLRSELDKNLIEHVEGTNRKSRDFLIVVVESRSKPSSRSKEPVVTECTIYR